MNKPPIDSKREIYLVKRARSFGYAGRGVWIFLKTTPNAWIHLAVLILVASAGVYYQISRLDWVLLVIAIGFVLVAEAFNTAIEIDINLTSPEYHPYARDTKDVAAGAVLLASLTAVIMGLLIFLPYF